MLIFSQIDVVKLTFPHDDVVILDETPRLKFAEGIRMLKESGWKGEYGKEPSEFEDLSTRAEQRLGQLVKEKYGADYYILDKFPLDARPFYTMPDHDDDVGPCCSLRRTPTGVADNDSATLKFVRLLPSGGGDPLGGSAYSRCSVPRAAHARVTGRSGHHEGLRGRVQVGMPSSKQSWVFIIRSAPAQSMTPARRRWRWP